MHKLYLLGNGGKRSTPNLPQVVGLDRGLIACTTLAYHLCTYTIVGLFSFSFLFTQGGQLLIFKSDSYITNLHCMRCRVIVMHVNLSRAHASMLT